MKEQTIKIHNTRSADYEEEEGLDGGIARQLHARHMGKRGIGKKRIRQT